MAALTLRLTKGSPLTNLEIDNNFSNLNTEVGTKLASSSYTAADILTKIKTVDGVGSGLDADLLGGLNQSSANTVSTIVARDASGDIYGSVFHGALTGNVTGNITGNADTVTNGVVTSGAYSNPAWITSLAGSKLTAIPNSSLTNNSITINGSTVALGGTVSISGTGNTWTALQTFTDNLFQLKDDLDTTKLLKFQVSNIGTGLTRTLIAPNEDGVISTQTFVNTTVNTRVPAGIITMWYGAVLAVPAGWNLCDGTNGTPDLRNRFIVGAGTTYAVGNTGGAADAPLVSHTHTANSSSAAVITDPGHRHVYGSDDQAASFGGYNTISTYGYDAQSTSSGAGVHTLTKNTSLQNAGELTNISARITTSTTINASGVSATNANLPPYYALCYIMKL